MCDRVIACGVGAVCLHQTPRTCSNPRPSPPPPTSAQTLPATSGPATSGSTAAADPAPAPPSSTPAAPAGSSPVSPAQSAALSKTRLQVAPIVGASVEAATPLTAELQARARQRGITLAGSTDQTATHVLKGYFSTMSEGSDTTVIYVWDIYDPAGNRLHRINGQQKAPSIKGGEGWAAVSGDHAGDRRSDDRPVCRVARRTSRVSCCRLSSGAGIS